MYWQKRFDRKTHNENLEKEFLKLEEKTKSLACRIYRRLRKQGLIVNKKRVQRIVQKLGLQVASFTRKSRKYNSIKARLERFFPIEFIDVLKLTFHAKRLQLTHLNLNNMK